MSHQTFYELFPYTWVQLSLVASKETTLLGYMFICYRESACTSTMHIVSTSVLTFDSPLFSISPDCNTVHQACKLQMIPHLPTNQGTFMGVKLCS